MATCQRTVVFPISQEDLQPNMIRYPKNKVLYLTLESDQDCNPSVKMTQNKKDIEDIAIVTTSLASPAKSRSAEDTESDEEDNDHRGGSNSKKVSAILKIRAISPVFFRIFLFML